MQRREFRPGDILVACDNVNGLLRGYMGHSAIVVDANKLVEATTAMPQIRMDSNKQFLKAHPIHVQYQPKSEEAGQRVAYCAHDYESKYAENLKQGIREPTLSFSYGRVAKWFGHFSIAKTGRPTSGAT